MKLIFFITLVASVFSEQDIGAPPIELSWKLQPLGCAVVKQDDRVTEVSEIRDEWQVVLISNKPNGKESCMKDLFYSQHDKNTWEWERKLHKNDEGEWTKTDRYITTVVKGNPFKLEFVEPYNWAGRGILTVMLTEPGRLILTYQAYELGGLCYGSFSVSVRGEVVLTAAERQQVDELLPEGVVLYPVNTECHGMLD